MANFGQFPDGVTVLDASEFVGYAPPAATGVPYLRWTGLEIYSYINGKLNLGGAAYLNVGTGAGTVAAGNDSRITGAVQAANDGTDFANASTTINNLLPSQAGASGKYLSSNGTIASWQAVSAGAAGPVGTGLAGNTIISSLGGSSDIDNAGANGDEFVQDTSGVPAGWTAIASGTPNTIDTNTNYSQLHMIANGGGGGPNEMKGIYKAIPGFPFTVTAKITDWSPWLGYGGTFNQIAAGLFVGEAGSTGKLLTLGGNNANSAYFYDLFVRLWASRTNATANLYEAAYPNASRPPIYLRMVVASTTSVKMYVSYSGYSWNQVPISGVYTAYNPSFTIAIVGLYVDGSDGTPAAEAFFDWIRFT